MVALKSAIDTNTPAAWTVAALTGESGWIFPLDDRARQDLARSVRRARDPEKCLLDYRREDFDLGSAGPVIAAAFAEIRDGRGIALVRGLPREDMAEPDFELLTWAIGLHTGVPRPQGKATHYLSAVRNAGTDYRSASGRGYSSSAELDFHTDGADVVALTCYNQGLSGGKSMVTSSVAAYHVLATERPELAEIVRQPFYFSRQAEQAPDEAAFYPNPLFAAEDGRLHSKWNRNRVNSAQKIEGVPPLAPLQREAMDVLDEILRRPSLMYEMYLQPGDMQLLNNHTTLHSRTEFVDHEDLARKRLLYRLWLAPPDGRRLPDSWKPFFRSIEPATVRGGILGQQHDARCMAFDARQAATLGMREAA